MDKNSPSNSDIAKAGTGFMINLADAIRLLQLEGYDINLVPQFDHFTYDDQKKSLYPSELRVDKVLRFENSSDPDDQSILYAISSKDYSLKGLYVDSYGTYHDNLSIKLLDTLASEPANQKNPHATEGHIL